jgi:hypothetical protein
MSFDFFPYEVASEMQRAAQRPSLEPDPGIWTGFAPGAARLTMQGFAKTARAIDLAGAVGPIVTDALTGGTTQQDHYFREHDDVFNRAVDYWTPRPNEVGTAGRVVGSLLPIVADFAIAPGLAIASAGLGTAEDLAREGVPAGKAVGAGMVDATGLGLGAWLPIFGKTLSQRLIYGAGANVGQGVAARAAQHAILDGEKAAERFNPWDGEAIVIDALMGGGFGTLTHLAAKGEAARRQLTATDRDAILVANQARHLEDTTAPGLPDTPADRTAHVKAMEHAIDDVLNDRPAEVGQVLQDARFLDDPARQAAQAEVRAAVDNEARSTMQDELGRDDAASTEPVAPTTRDDVRAYFEGNEGALKMVTEDGRVVDPLEEIDRARERVAQARSDSRAFQVAAECLLTRATGTVAE